MRVLVTGGAGYVGSVLVPELLRNGHEVVVLDLYAFRGFFSDGGGVLPGLTEIVGDIRDRVAVRKAVEGCEAVIHLAAVSNDPSCDLDPALARSINLGAFGPLLEECQQADIRRFILASSSSVYGVRDEPRITEDLPLRPITDYARYKAECERLLFDGPWDFDFVIVRPGSVCGPSFERQRFDLIVNIFVNQAMAERRIKVTGGKQMRPNIDIMDMSNVYVQALDWSWESVSKAGCIFNAGFENRTVMDIARVVQTIVQDFGYYDVDLEVVETNDPRSYHVDSTLIQNTIGFKPELTVEDAVEDLVYAFEEGIFPNSLIDSRYYNVWHMQAHPEAWRRG